MNCINILCAYVCFVCTVAKVRAAGPRNKGKPSVKLADLPFNPCRTSSRMPAASKKRHSKCALRMVSECGLKVATLIDGKAASRQRVQAIASRLVTSICLACRIAYSYFADPNGRLSERLAVNGSVIYAMINQLYHFGFLNTSISPEMCVRDVKTGRMFCTSKAKILRFIDEGLPCLQQAMKDKLPDHSDAAVFALDAMMKFAEKNGLLQYVRG